MATFFLELIPPRPSFAEDMTEAERAFMAEHVAYWLGLSARREAVVFGAVADPKGAWGLAVLDVEDAAPGPRPSPRASGGPEGGRPSSIRCRAPSCGRDGLRRGVNWAMVGGSGRGTMNRYDFPAAAPSSPAAQTASDAPSSSASWRATGQVWDLSARRACPAPSRERLM